MCTAELVGVFANNENRFSMHHGTVPLFQTHLENGLLSL
jgi:hypothetical protein